MFRNPPSLECSQYPHLFRWAAGSTARLKIDPYVLVHEMSENWEYSQLTVKGIKEKNTCWQIEGRSAWSATQTSRTENLLRGTTLSIRANSSGRDRFEETAKNMQVTLILPGDFCNK